MRIKQVTDEHILFDDGSIITFNHDQDCCENNFADFSSLNENNIHYNHNFIEPLDFKFVEGAGFMFGNEIHGVWIFIPCYSDQNGYYTDNINIDILYNGKKVLTGKCIDRFY